MAMGEVIPIVHHISNSILWLPKNRALQWLIPRRHSWTEGRSSDLEVQFGVAGGLWPTRGRKCDPFHLLGLLLGSWHLALTLQERTGQSRWPLSRFDGLLCTQQQDNTQMLSIENMLACTCLIGKFCIARKGSWLWSTFQRAVALINIELRPQPVPKSVFEELLWVIHLFVLFFLSLPFRPLPRTLPTPFYSHPHHVNVSFHSFFKKGNLYL